MGWERCAWRLHHSYSLSQWCYRPQTCLFQVQPYYISPRKTSAVVLLTVLFYDSRIVRNKRNSGGQITEEESTNNTIYEWSTKPVRKCLTETLLPQPFLWFSQARGIWVQILGYNISSIYKDKKFKVLKVFYVFFHCSLGALWFVRMLMSSQII